MATSIFLSSTVHFKLFCDSLLYLLKRLSYPVGVESLSTFMLLLGYQSKERIRHTCTILMGKILLICAYIIRKQNIFGNDDVKHLCLGNK